jgi:hypothetical protein
MNAIKEARDKIEKTAAFLLKMSKEAKGFDECMTAIVEAYRILFWSLNELGTYEGMDADTLNQVSTQSRLVAQQGFSLADVIKHTKHVVMPYLMERNRHYSAEQGKRKKKLAKITSKLKKTGITLPGRSLAALFKDKPLTPPMSFVVRGSAQDVRDALKLISYGHMKFNGGEPTYLSSLAGETKGDFATTIMPPAWWKNSAREIAVLESTLHSVVDSESLLLLVEDLEMLFTLDSGNEVNTPRRRKAVALGRLYSWAFNNQISLVVGDITDEDVPDAGVYGSMPNIAVGHVDSEKGRHLVIGNDTLTPLPG